MEPSVSSLNKHYSYTLVRPLGHLLHTQAHLPTACLHHSTSAHIYRACVLNRISLYKEYKEGSHGGIEQGYSVGFLCASLAPWVGS